MNNPQLIQDFKDYLIETLNEDVYYQLKEYLNQVVEDDDVYSDTLDYIIDNLHGSLQWVDN